MIKVADLTGKDLDYWVVEAEDTMDANVLFPLDWNDIGPIADRDNLLWKFIKSGEGYNIQISILDFFKQQIVKSKYGETINNDSR